ncbi:MAG: hypothetical protein ACREH4_05715 [Vitreimonas sp.]
MTDFDALLKRSFAEAHEPVDDGFSINVGHAVARREAAAKARGAFQVAGVALACGALAYGAYSVLAVLGPEVAASAGIEIARAHGAISNAPSIGGAAQSLWQSMSAGMTQILLVTAALAGGAVAYRVSQD